jgi:pimeloyl-ACP methyl ester carboxylesterase
MASYIPEHGSSSLTTHHSPLTTHHSPNAPLTKLTLSDCLQRWRREARHGHFDTAHYRCRYYSWGQGPPLIFIPGLSLESTSFVMPMAWLQAQFRCIGYELPTGNGYRHRDLRDDLFALLDHLKIERCHLVGFSFGSTIALAALAHRPERFARALLVGGFARRPLAWTEVLLGHWVRYCPGRISDVPGFGALAHRRSAELFQARPAGELEHFCAAEGRPWLRTFATRALLMHQTDLRPLLPRILQPVLLVHGDHDGHVGRAYQDELKRGLPNAALAEIEGCGHYPQLTHPEVFSEIVQQFLTPAVCPAEHGAPECAHHQRETGHDAAQPGVQDR